MQNFILKGREIVFCVSKSSCNQALYLKCYELAFLYKFWFTLCRRLREFMAFVDKKYLRLLGRHGFQEPSCSQAGMALACLPVLGALLVMAFVPFSLQIEPLA